MKGGAPVSTGTVSAVRAAGAYDVVSLTVPGGWANARPGQLVVIPADPAGGTVLPAVHWLVGVHQDPVHGTSIELLMPSVAPVGTGATLRLLGPLGRGFATPSSPVPVLLVGHGSGAAPLRWLVDRLRARKCPVHLVLSADDPDRHLELGTLRRLVDSIVLCHPEDLAVTVDRVLHDPACDPAVVYAVLPPDIGTTVAQITQLAGRVCRIAPLDLDAEVVCGTGVCGGCELETGGRQRIRPCLDGPVLPGDMLTTTAAAGQTGARGGTGR